MSTIETFYNLQARHSDRQNPYLRSLLALTNLTPRQVHAFTSDMIWLEW